jgi:hypothetical protein
MYQRPGKYQKPVGDSIHQRAICNYLREAKNAVSDNEEYTYIIEMLLEKFINHDPQKPLVFQYKDLGL